MDGPNPAPLANRGFNKTPERISSIHSKAQEGVPWRPWPRLSAQELAAATAQPSRRLAESFGFPTFGGLEPRGLERSGAPQVAQEDSVVQTNPNQGTCGRCFCLSKGNIEQTNEAYPSKRGFGPVKSPCVQCLSKSRS